MIEIPLLATYLISFFVPLLKKGAEGLISDLRDDLGDDLAKGVASETKSLWQKLKDKFTRSSDGADDSPEKAVIDTFEKAPGDLTGKSLEEVLKQILQDDPEFRRAAEQLVQKGAAPGTTWNITAGDNANIASVQTGNVSGGTITGMTISGPSGPGRPDPAPEPPVGDG